MSIIIPKVLPNPTVQEILKSGLVAVIMPAPTWKPIRHYEGLYEISNTGHYRNAKTKKVLKFVKNNHGYMRAELYKKAVRKRFMIHRLVAHAFCDIPKGYTLMDVNHKDGNKLNNQEWNLEYLTKSDNHAHRHHVLGKNNFLSGEEIPVDNSGPVVAIDLSHEKEDDSFHITDPNYWSNAAAELAG